MKKNSWMRIKQHVTYRPDQRPGLRIKKKWYERPELHENDETDIESMAWPWEVQREKTDEE